MKRTAKRAKKLITLHSSLVVLIALAVLCTGIGVYALLGADKQVVAADTSLKRSVNDLFEQAMHQIKEKKQAEEVKKQADEAARIKTEAEAAEAASAAEQAKQQTAATFKCSSSGPHSDPLQVDVIANKKHCLNPVSYYPPDLQTMYGATLSAKAASAFSAMYEAAAAAGAGFQTSSSFRSYDNQVATYNYWVRMSGSVAGADTGSARPGYSEHQTGYAADLSVGSCSLDCFGGTAQYQWLLQHGAEYGFIERYPSGSEGITGYRPEPWHWRFVGSDIAQAMKASGIRTLEQYFGVEGGDYR